MENLQKNTPIKNFVEIYNSNNFEISETLSRLQTKIEELESEYASFKVVAKNKLASLEGEIRSMIPQVNDTIEQKFVEFYNYIGNDNQDNTQTTQETDAQVPTLEGTWEGIIDLGYGYRITKLVISSDMSSGRAYYEDNGYSTYTDISIEIGQTILITFRNNNTTLQIYDYMLRSKHFTGLYKYNNTIHDFDLIRTNP